MRLTHIVFWLHCFVSNRTKVFCFFFEGVFVFNVNVMCVSVRERYVRASDLAAHKRSSYDCALLRKQPKAHILRTVSYVWISP